MSKPVLYVFAISHYCEKARWALDYLDIEYELKCVGPGIHRKIAQKLGAPGTSVPILTAGEDVIQGSSDIIDWAEANKISPSKSLTPPVEALDDCKKIETRFGTVTGIHVRRYYYSEAMIEYPETVKPILTKDVPFLHWLMVSWNWKLIRKLMIKGLDLGPAQFEESGRALDEELLWLDGILADGRQYLVGDRFSRADITAASILAPLTNPEEHPTYEGLEHPPRLAKKLATWKDRASIQWVHEIYRKYR